MFKRIVRDESLGSMSDWEREVIAIFVATRTCSGAIRNCALGQGWRSGENCALMPPHIQHERAYSPLPGA